MTNERKNSEPSEIELLHERLFGFRPNKDGTAYERLTAVVLATQGWVEVVHSERARAPDKQAVHWLDVNARAPDGSISRLIVECKDWDKTVKKGTLDQLVGICAQLGAEGMVITTEGYSKGARKVAVDQDIAMVLLRPYDADEGLNFVRRIEVTLEMYVPRTENILVDLLDEGPLPDEPFTFNLWNEEHLSHLDGRPAETVLEVFESESAGDLRLGSFPHRREFPDGRLLPTPQGPVGIRGLQWDEVVGIAEQKIVREAEGEPCLVLEQLDQDGELETTRAVVDRDLFAWTIDSTGHAQPVGSLQPK